MKLCGKDLTPDLAADRRNRPSWSGFLHTWAYHLVRLILAGVFIYAGSIKLLDPPAFARSLAQFGLLPDPLLPVMAVGLPALELLAGVGLIFEVRGSLGLITGLLALFLLVLGYAIWMEMEVDCGCFTVDEINAQNSVKHAFLRDLVMLGAIFFLNWRHGFQKRKTKKLPISKKGEAEC
jgi:hypothetical protein